MSPGKRRKPIQTAVRRLVHERDKGVCQDCGLDTVLLADQIEWAAQVVRQITGVAIHADWYAQVATDMGLGGGDYSPWRLPPLVDLDHIKPLAFGGANDESNIQTLCKRCHHQKTHKVDLPAMVKPRRLSNGGKTTQPLDWRKAKQPKPSKLERLSSKIPTV